MRNLVGSARLRLGVLAVAGAALLVPVLTPKPALAWWRGGFGVAIGVPPVVVAPAPAYYPPYYPPPAVAYAPPVRQPVWVPPHWQGAYWVPGHWA